MCESVTVGVWRSEGGSGEFGGVLSFHKGDLRDQIQVVRLSDKSFDH